MFRMVGAYAVHVLFTLKKNIVKRSLRLLKLNVMTFDFVVT